MSASAHAAPFILAQASAAFAADPYPTYAHLRAHDPVCRQPDGSLFLTRYDDVRAVITDAERFSSDKRVDFLPKFGHTPLYEHHTTSLVFNDPPYHTRVRRLLGPFFTVQAMRRMENSVATMVDDLLDSAADKRVIDIMSEFALAIPLNLVGDLLGVPRQEREPLRNWASLILGGLEPVRSADDLAAGNRAVTEFKAYLGELIAAKRRRGMPPADPDVLDALIRDHDSGDGLSIDEILHNCIFMLNAGHDTTTSLITNGVDLLLRFPDQKARLVADPALLRTAIEEMLRFESPLQIGNRKALVDCEVGGTRIAAGTFLHVCIASADHDEAQFPAAETFDIGRNPNRHLAFGHGIHFCAGNAVARMEASLAFGRLLARFPDFERAGPTIRPPRWRFRVIDELKVDLRP
ncbi:MAG: cytochrome P450 [Burkholderiales bacterium]|nr:cytochrome P450 [Burkholderiales bacterium]